MPYRPYIDGLRAIAVIAVIWFHFGWPALAGGFAGVDVFFVISGFLITQLLAEPSALPLSGQLAQFYLRRARRILPALVAVSLVVAAAGFLIYLPADLARLGRYLVFASLMLGNIANWQDGGYFAPFGYYSSPLSHYWSLAVEEQFYVVYPIVFLLLLKPRRFRPDLALALIGGASIALCVLGTPRHTDALFYLAPARAWELMLGGIAASCRVTGSSRRAVAEGVSALCIGAVLLSFHTLTPATGFPHLPAAIPCFATALLLFTGRQRATWVTKLLSLPPLAFTGRISYSLYLWHVPILAFAQYFMIRKLSFPQQAVLALAMYGTLILSWRYIENPVRNKRLFRSDRKLVIAVSGACLAVALIGAGFWITGGLPGRLSRDLQILARVEPFPEKVTLCRTLPLPEIAGGRLCRFGAPGSEAPRAVLWGDSHALALLPAFDGLAKSHGMQLYFAYHYSCRPLLSGFPGSPGPQDSAVCDSFNAAMLTAVQRLKPEVTILSAFWDLNGFPPAVESSLAFTVSAITDTGSSACVVLDVPELPYVMPYALVVARRRGIDTDFLYPKRADTLASNFRFEQAARELDARKALTLVDPKNLLCAGKRCDLEWNGRSLYRDASHLTDLGAMRVQSALAQCLQKGR